jgi:surface protein
MNIIGKVLVLLCIIFGAQSVSAAPIVAGSFSTTWDTNTETQVSVNLGGCPTSVYWEELGNEANNGTSSICVGSDIQVTFPSPGQYRVDYSGSFTSISFGDFWDASDINRDLFRTVEQWGDSEWVSLSGAFFDVPNLTFNASDVPNLSQTTVMSVMFQDATNFNSDISNWDVSNVTDMWGMFWGASSFNQPLNNWDVSNNQRFWRMFSGASSFNQPLDSWDVSSVDPSEGFNEMFSGASSFNQSITGWDVANVMNFNSMFSGASSFNQPLNNWNMASATDISYMFNEANDFNQPLNNWNLSNATNADYVFNNATSFNQSLGDWPLSTGVTLNSIFDGSAIDTDNYTATLIGWAGINLMPSVGQENIGSVPATYCDTAQSARDILTTVNNWSITDLGSVPCVTEPVAEVGSASDSTATRIAERPLREVRTVTRESFIASVKELLAYLDNNEEELNALTPEESSRLIIAMRDIVSYLLSWLPGI